MAVMKSFTTVEETKQAIVRALRRYPVLPRSTLTLLVMPETTRELFIEAFDQLKAEGTIKVVKPAPLRVPAHVLASRWHIIRPFYEPEPEPVEEVTV
jgi:hypothetical protein